ncbi:MAG: spermidine synthase [Gammaproteobacteria bacterium]|nr:MAG: spermidine synthase [Gammaproteobacteria bacterium]
MENTKRLQHVALLFATFVIAICGLVYELLAGTLSSYLLGDSVYQFSLVIGLFMSSMGVGSWLSRFIEQELPANFVKLQLLVGVLGGLTAPLLFFAFAILDNYTPLLFLLVLLLGGMLGVEIPLIIRILKEHAALKINLSNVFTADYIGALIAALLFPLVLIPQLGLLQTGFLFGLLNAAVGLLALYVFRQQTPQRRQLALSGLATIALLIGGLVYSESFTSRMENRLYQDEIIYAQDTDYQRIVLTRRQQRLRFYINGALQFDSYDEYRYHESLVHPAMSVTKNPQQILILGGGDGLAIRELLRYETLEKITLVDLDPVVTQLFSSNPQLRELNQDSLSHPKVEIFNQDAWKFLEKNQTLFDVVLIDLPDPNNPSLSRLYSTSFYKLLKQHVSQQGVIVTQATSPLYAREAFWSIAKTLGQAANGEKWQTLPYHTYIPSFGDWGFVMASRQQLNPQKVQLTQKHRYLSQEMLPQLFNFAPDVAKVAVEINQISTHPLLKYYEEGWSYWYE